MIFNTAEAQRDILRYALEHIKATEGRVCSDFELCKDDSCQSSYSAWAIADMALSLCGFHYTGERVVAERVSFEHDKGEPGIYDGVQYPFKARVPSSDPAKAPYTVVMYDPTHGFCQCDGFKHRFTCRHLEAAKLGVRFGSLEWQKWVE